MTKKILVIDDDYLVVNTLEKYLKSCGYSVETAQSGKEAIEKTKEIKFDLIISDIRMPDLGGIETLRRIGEISTDIKRTPAIIVTAYAGEDEVYKEGIELGVTDFIYKPFDLDEFIQVIRKNFEVPTKPKEILFDYKLLDSEFISTTENMKEFLQKTKDRFDRFDEINDDERKQLEFIEENKKEIFDKLDEFFDRIWKIVENFEKDKYIIHQSYYQEALGYLLLELIETNRHVYQKPFGYSGDYIMMNYIYDYNGNTRYPGDSSYEKLINNYTCNIPISCSVVERKNFLKEEILKIMERKVKAKILNVACGPARELIELLKEGKITKPIVFKLLDFEKKALDYVNREINRVEYKKRQFLSIEYICRDITSIIRDREFREDLREQDLIYATGLFDYLSERMAPRLTRELYQLLADEGKLIICNASLENNTHRAYYELLGGWNIIHRTEKEILKWVERIDGIQNVNLKKYMPKDRFLYLIVEK